MKKIVNKLRFALLLGFVAMSVTAWSQAVPYINKMSITTQMFLDEMAGRLSFDEEAPALPSKFTSPGARQLPAPYRPIATPDTIDGKVYISAIVRVNNMGNDVSALEELGVIIQCKFDKGIVTTLIPVDKIDEVSALEGVKRIEVASVMRSLTDRSRTASNVDDVLTLSQDARNAGLLQVYDGSGVVLAIIDDGVDFQHGAFKDANGNSRIVGAYCYNGSSVTADWYGSGTLPTTDDSSEDHGTHTSTTAGGSSVIVSGTTVTVTADHSQATYGGMAPGADLYLCGTQLYDTHILKSFQRMCEYADAQGKPLVVSNSWGGMMYANDGSSSVSDVLAQYFGENNPNHIALFASGNEAGKSAGGVTGGYYVTGPSTSANPLGTIIRTESYIENYNYSYYSGILCNAWTRATDADGIAVHAYVINKSSGALTADLGTFLSTNYNAGSYATLGTSNYFGRSFLLYFDYTEAGGKHQAMIYTSNYTTSGTSYALAVEVYPIGGSDSNVDIWGGTYTYLAGNVTTSGHTWTAGTDDMSSTGECTNENVIAVGSYVTRTRSGSNSVGEISDFSSYALESTGPCNVMLPWITAPGEDIISGLNHYVSSHDVTVSVNNSSSPYGLMSGTSMATPAAAGIVALWFQAAQEVGKDLTLSEVKNIMAQTAIKDNYVTNGTYKNRFGNGKIDALAGVQYILDNYSSTDPTIRPSSTALTYTGEPNGTYTQQVTVMGSNLTGNITATLSDPSNVFSMTVTSSASLNSPALRANGSTTLNSGDVLNITYAPTAVGTHTGTITLTSDGAESKTITLNGTAAIIQEADICDGTETNQYLPVYGYWYDAAQVNQMLYPAEELTAKGMANGQTITSLTFFPATVTTGSWSTTTYSGINFRNGSVTVKLANMPAGTSGYAATATRKDATFTTVKTISMPSTAQTSLTEWVFDNLENDFVYEGGDLLVEVTTTAGNYGYTYFYGKNQTSYTGYYSYNSTSTGQQFLPKVHFTFEGGSTTPVVETPVIAPADGSEFSSAPQEVTITCGTAGATIYYSTDGGNTYNVYNGPFNVSGNTTVTAYATATDMTDSQTASATYTFKPEAPVITPATGDLVYGQEVTITCPTSGAPIYYSTDGGNTYNEYTGAFTMNGDGTVMAYAAVSGWDNSQTVSATYTLVYPTLTVNPAQVMIEDATGDARTSETITVTSENVSGSMTTTASNNWTANLLRSNASMTLTYGGKALHQTGSGTVSQGGLTAGVSAEYLYTGPIYVIGDVNGYAWNTSNGVQLTRDENGFYTGTITTQQSSDAAYIIFTKRLGDDTSYRFGPVSSGNWWLTSDLEDVYAPIDTTGVLNNIRLGAGTWFVTIDSYNNQFKIRPAVTSSSVSPAEGTLNYGQVNVNASATQTITITNDGEVAYTPSVNVTGAYTTDYTPAELAPGESVTVTVTFTPTTDGAANGTMTVTAGNDTYNYTLTGTGHTPVVHGYVDQDDQNINFGEKNIGTTTTHRVRIYNDGEEAFTPTLDLSDLTGPFTVVGNAEVSPDGYIDLTVRFNPSNEGEYSTWFVVDINGSRTFVYLSGTAVDNGGSGDDSGNGVTTIRERSSNVVSVPVFKTEMEVYAPYNYAQVATQDTLPRLTPNVTNATSVQILSKRPIAINGYNLYHNPGSANNTVDDANWAVNSHKVSFSMHDKVSNSYLPYDIKMNGDSVQRPITLFPSSDVNDIWVDHIDTWTVTDEDTYYVPVVVANGKVTPNNTYGSPIEESPLGGVSLVVSYSQGRTEQVNGETYIWMTAGGTIAGFAPTLVEDGHRYENYRYRVWRVVDTDTVLILDKVTTESRVSFGSNQFTFNPTTGRYEADENSFLVPVDQEVKFIGRFYYVRTPLTAPTLRVAEETIGQTESSSEYLYYVCEAEGETTFTSVSEINAGKEIVDVMYVNPLGMTSDRPFEGVNIVITRYSDGTTSTVKVLK